jgi:hypothetical protein
MARQTRPGRSKSDADRNAEESRRILERIEQESASFGGSWFARTARRARGHFTGADKAGEDPIEVWGTRIGRAIALVLFIALLIFFLRAVALA